MYEQVGLHHFLSSSEAEVSEGKFVFLNNRKYFHA